MDNHTLLYEDTKKLPEVFTKSDINKITFPASGTKTFTIPFVIKQAGKTVLPPIEFSYLDIDKQEYKKVKSDSITILVSAALKNKFDANKLSQDITNHKYIWIVPLIALVVGISWWLRFGRKKQQEKNIAIATKEEINSPLTETESLVQVVELTAVEKLNELLLLETDKAFFTQTKQFGFDLLEKEADPEKRKALIQIIEQCNEALYSPVAAINKESVFRALEKLV